MDTTQAIILALVQGITEFLPISSSAHLILVPLFTEWPDQGLAYDVALNTATLLAICIYLRKDLAELVGGLFSSSTKTPKQENLYSGHEKKLVAMILVATIPTAIAGYLFHDVVATTLRTSTVIAYSSIFWGLVLLVSQRFSREGEVRDIGWGRSFMIGLSQAASLTPGTSRSGITMTAGLFSGLSRKGAARFSFLLSIPIGALAAAHQISGLINGTVVNGAHAGHIALGFILSFVAAYVSIDLFLKFIERASFTPFVIYRVLLGIILLLLF